MYKRNSRTLYGFKVRDVRSSALRGEANLNIWAQ